MNSKEIATLFLSIKINDTKDIFYKDELFDNILFWSREAAREYFVTQQEKYFLQYYIDDIAPIVDSYLKIKMQKMYKNAFKKRNKLYESLYSTEKTISWIINRWINTFINLTSNPNYRDFIDIKNLKVEFFDDTYSFIDNKIEIDTEFEKAKRLPKKEKIKLLKEVWKEAKYDDFDELDMKYLVEKLDLTMDEVFENKGDLSKLNLKKEQVLNGGSQLVLVF
jgi:hypothetical protein